MLQYYINMWVFVASIGSIYLFFQSALCSVCWASQCFLVQANKKKKKQLYKMVQWNYCILDIIFGSHVLSILQYVAKT